MWNNVTYSLLAKCDGFVVLFSQFLQKKSFSLLIVQSNSVKFIGYLNFSRLTSKNEEKWLPVIKSSYPEGQTISDSRIVICDLHFDESEILEAKGKKNLVKTAVPKFL